MVEIVVQNSGISDEFNSALAELNRSETFQIVTNSYNAQGIDRVVLFSQPGASYAPSNLVAHQPSTFLITTGETTTKYIYVPENSQSYVKTKNYFDFNDGTGVGPSDSWLNHYNLTPNDYSNFSNEYVAASQDWSQQYAARNMGTVYGFRCRAAP